MEYKEQLNIIKDNFEKSKIFYINETACKNQLQKRKKAIKIKADEISNDIDILEQVRILLQKTSQFAREQAKRQIENLVTNCLEYIFNSNMEFKIEINEVRGRPEAEFYIISNYSDKTIKTKPQDARGGGVVDTISLALRIALLHCNTEQIDGPIILDEPAKHVSDDYIVQIAQFLCQTAEIFKRQIIMVTHNRHLSETAKTTYKVELVNGVSEVNLIDS